MFTPSVPVISTSPPPAVSLSAVRVMLPGADNVKSPLGAEIFGTPNVFVILLYVSSVSFSSSPDVPDITIAPLVRSETFAVANVLAPMTFNVVLICTLPLTSSEVPGVDVLIPILSLVTSKYNKSVSNARSMPLLVRLLASISPFNLLIAIMSLLYCSSCE